jgi:hypothetical protein
MLNKVRRFDKEPGRNAKSDSGGLSNGTATARADHPEFDRRWFLVLACIALIYAFLASLRTVAEYDNGWQMATGRWVVQHHQVPSVDVLSYTAQGQPWIYPVGAMVIFYLAFLAGGYTLLSWIGAAAVAS